MKNKKIGSGEITLYVVFAIIALAGLTLAALNIIGMNIANIDNPLRVADEAFAAVMKMDFLLFGSLLIVVAGILFAITLSVNGSKAELIEEKRIRKQQRMALEEGTELE